jgi:hypothetical protein
MFLDGWVGGWVGGWMEGWMGGWVEVKAVLRIAYSNQKHIQVTSLLDPVFFTIKILSSYSNPH